MAPCASTTCDNLPLLAHDLRLHAHPLAQDFLHMGCYLACILARVTPTWKPECTQDRAHIIAFLLSYAAVPALPCRPASCRTSGKDQSRVMLGGEGPFMGNRLCGRWPAELKPLRLTRLHAGVPVQARDVLMDPGKRAAYEEELRAAHAAAAAGGPSSSEQPQQQQRWGEGGGRGGRQQQRGAEEAHDHMPCECEPALSHAAYLSFRQPGQPY